MLDQIIQRLVRIAKFDTTVFEEIEHDENANTEAAIVVVVASLLAALGAAISGGGATGFGFSLVMAVISWLIWSYLTMFMGTRLFQGETNFWEMARVIGYASAPNALGILGVFGCLGGIVSFAASILSLVISVIAIREALDLPTEKAILTAVIGWIVIVVVTAILGSAVLGVSMLAMGAQ